MCADACFRLVHDSGTLPALPTAHSEKPMTLATQMNVCTLLQRSQQEVSHTAGKLNQSQGKSQRKPRDLSTGRSNMQAFDPTAAPMRSTRSTRLLWL